MRSMNQCDCRQQRFSNYCSIIYMPLSRIQLTLFLYQVSMGGTLCCENTLARDHSYSIINQQPLLYGHYSPHQFPYQDPAIAQWISQHENSEVLKTMGMKHKITEKYFMGNWNEGTPEGKGLIYVPKIYIYEGYFREGFPYGYCNIKLLQTDCEFQGNMLDGKAEGMGIFKDNKAKVSFEGLWKDCLPKTGSLIFFEDPDIESIEFKDYQEGEGIIYFRNKQKYTGKIHRKKMIPHGQGKITFPFQSDKFEFEGTFVNGKMHGQGHLFWKDKSQYIGEYIQGNKCGYGKYIFNSGKSYEGYWIDGKQQGPGILFSDDYTPINTGIWKEGKFLKQCSQQQFEYSKRQLQQEVERKKKQAETLQQLQNPQLFNLKVKSPKYQLDRQMTEKTQSGHDRNEIM